MLTLQSMESGPRQDNGAPRLLKVPNAFRAVGLDWKVEFGNVVETHDKYAVTDFRRQIISMEKDMSPQLQSQTFLHELLHVVIWSMGLNRSVDALEDSDTEEAIVDAMANGLHQILSDQRLFSE